MVLPLVKGTEPLLPAGRNEHVTPTSAVREWRAPTPVDPPSATTKSPFDINAPIAVLGPEPGCSWPAADVDADEKLVDGRVLSGSTRWRKPKT